MVEHYRESISLALTEYIANPGCEDTADHFGGLVAKAGAEGLCPEFLQQNVDRANEVYRRHLGH